MKTLMRLGGLVVPVLALGIGCARDPDVSKFTCTSPEHCPANYVCTGTPGAPGKCIRATASPDAASSDAPLDPGGVDATVDGSRDTAAVDVLRGVDGPPMWPLDAADVSLGGSGDGAGGAGGSTSQPGDGGAGGYGGQTSPLDGALGSGGQGAGGAGGDGGGSSLGGAGGGAPGTGGTSLPGTGGSTGGAGGTSVLGTGGSEPGTGGTTGPQGGTPTATGGANGGTTTAITGTGGVATGGTTTGQGGAGGIPGGITVNRDKIFQTIQGFGINTAMMPSSETIPIDDVFGTTGPGGIGLSILRVGMTTSGQLMGKYVAEAKAKGAKVIGSTWSPPASCKSNSSTRDGGYLLETCYDSWATTIAAFAQAQGLYAMSIASEPDFASCPGVPVCTDTYDTTTFTAKQMVAWVKVVGPKLAAVGVKIIAPEVAEWIHAWSNASATGSLVASHPNSSDPHKCGCFSNTPTVTGCDPKCLSGDGYDYGHWLWADQEAWSAFDIFGVHQHDSHMAYAWPADVNGGKRDKEVWQTEAAGLMHWPEQGPTTDIDNGLAVAGWIHSALTVGEASAWLYWWYEAYYQNDNEGLALTKGGSTIAKRYYTLGNYSRFVRPGYLAVEVSGNARTEVLLSAYKSPDGASVAIVAINKGASAVTAPITILGGTAPATCTPYVTSGSPSENLKAGTAVSVTGGAFTASLGATSVTTYDCR